MTKPIARKPLLARRSIKQVTRPRGLRMESLEARNLMALTVQGEDYINPGGGTGYNFNATEDTQFVANGVPTNISYGAEAVTLRATTWRSFDDITTAAPN